MLTKYRDIEIIKLLEEILTKSRIRRRAIKKKNKLFNTLKFFSAREKMIIVSWWAGAGGKNWGDALNPVLVKQLSGKESVRSDEIINITNEPIFSVIGSILEGYCSENTIIWGSGFISSTDKLKKEPKKICAVRGPLTREIIIKQGIDCPKIYGDPALLYPLLYNPTIEKKYKLGIIPHFMDKDHPSLKLFEGNSEILVIDILDEINKVVDSICSCELIASSSLHGIIASDSYGIKSIWLVISNDIGGDNFKFYDYFESVGRKNEKPFIVTENTTLESMYDYFHEYKLNIDLSKLLDSCPFLNKDKKIELIKMLETS